MLINLLKSICYLVYIFIFYSAFFSEPSLPLSETRLSIILTVIVHYLVISIQTLIEKKEK